jgi:hypothetical protein
VDATISIDAAGHVTEVALKPGLVAAPMDAALVDALRRATAFVPAIQDGKFLPGTYAYHLTVPH